MMKNTTVCIIGSGVVGLSTGIELLETYGNKIQVIVISKDELKNTNSAKSGAHWFPSFESSDLRKKMERWTFQRFEELSKKFPKSETGINRVKANRFYPEKIPKDPWWSDVAYNFKHITDLPSQYKDGIEYETYVSSMVVYLPWIQKRFVTLGGKIVNREIKCLSEVAEELNSNVVIDCSGLGALNIKGIEDGQMYPVRGQSILVRAPFIDRLLGNQGLGRTPLPTYIIPLMVDNLVLLGATSQNHDWNKNISQEDRSSILERCSQIVPQLKDLKKEDFVADNVGLRPERKGGPIVNYNLLKNYNGKGYDIHLIRNNGHGGYGVQSSWGSARLVLELFENLQKSKL